MVLELRLCGICTGVWCEQGRDAAGPLGRLFRMTSRSAASLCWPRFSDSLCSSRASLTVPWLGSVMQSRPAFGRTRSCLYCPWCLWFVWSRCKAGQGGGEPTGFPRPPARRHRPTTYIARCLYAMAVSSLMIACWTLEPYADMDPGVPGWAGRGLTDQKSGTKASLPGFTHAGNGVHTKCDRNLVNAAMESSGATEARRAMSRLDNCDRLTSET